MQIFASSLKMWRYLILIALFALTFVSETFGAWQQYGPRFDLVNELRNKHMQEKEAEQRICFPIAIPPILSPNDCPSTPPSEPDELQPWVSVSVKNLHDSFYRRVFNLLLDKGLFYNERNSRRESPYNFKNPEQISSEVDFTLGADGVSEDDLVKIIEKVIEFSPHVSHPFHLHRRTSGLDPYGIAADFMEATMSSIMVTYLFSPMFTLMENEMYKEIRKLVYDPSEGKGDGVGTPIPNTMALQLALQNRYPDWKYQGWNSIPKATIFISEHGDYSALKAANWEGVGLDSVILVKADKNGRMDLASLKESIQKSKADGREPLMVVGTAGTPILGAIDPLDGIASIAEENGMWFHVEAQCGGAVLMSDNKKALLKGIERSDTFSWTPSCLLAVPYSAGMIFSKKENIFQPAFNSGPNVVHENNSLYDVHVWDLGEKTIQTSRRPDVFKFWYMWKAKGRNGLGEHVDYTYTMSDYLVREIRGRGSIFQLILDKFDTPFVSFYYIPPTLRRANQNSPAFIEQMNSFTDKLKNDLLQKGLFQTSISISSLENKPNFFTFNLGNSALTQNDVKYILDQIEHVGGGGGLFAPRAPLPPRRFPNFVSAPIESQHRRFYRDLFQLNLEKGIYFQDKRNEPSLLFRTPDELKMEFDFTLGQEGIQHDRLLKIMDDVIKYSYHQAHPYWLYQLLTGLDPYTIVADIVLGTVSSPQLTYEDNPIFTIAENEVSKAIRTRIGWGENGDGFFTEGGSASNQMALRMAIHKKFPQVKSIGLKSLGKKLVYYISKDAHYSQIKSAFLNGIGMDNCILIDLDKYGRMDVQKLRNAIDKTLSEGGVPFFIGATTGTTILGAYDNLEEITQVAEENELWVTIKQKVLRIEKAKYPGQGSSG